MASRDLLSNIKELTAFNPADITSDGQTDGVEIDTAGYSSCTFVFGVGTKTTGTITPIIEETDTSGTYADAAVADSDLLPPGTGQEASAALTASNGIAKLAYRGDKQYVRLSFVGSSSASYTCCWASAILAHPDGVEAPIA